MSQSRPQTVLITGVCGMIGSHLADSLLERGYRVVGMDDLSFGNVANIRRFEKQRRFRFVRGDVRNSRKVLARVEPCSVIAHLAAVKKIGESTPALPTLSVNACGTHAMLDVAAAWKAKLLLGSTSDVYGTSTDLPFSETGSLRIGASTAKRWAYAVSKLYAEHLAMAFWKDAKVPVVIVRYFGGFSERANTGWSGGHVPIFIRSILDDKPVVIHGDGLQTRCMAHVSDLVNGTVLALESPRAVGEIINLGNDEEWTILETAKFIHRLARTGRPLRLKFVPMKKVFGSYEEIVRRIPDLRKARRLLGYRPRVRFKDALERVIDEMKRS